jgi:hypothetical protein
MEIGNKSQAISILIEVLRSLPPGDTTVSKDCMVTTIQRVPPHAHVRYERYGTAEAAVASSTQTFTVPVSFSPWILTPEWLTTPQVMSALGGYGRAAYSRSQSRARVETVTSRS